MAGRQLGRKGRCPLMYEWHGKKYWGAAHGLAGIMHALMDMELKPDEVEDVKGTLRYMINNRLPSGNYPSSEGSENDRLVHCCHGAPGLTLTLVKATEKLYYRQFSWYLSNSFLKQLYFPQKSYIPFTPGHKHETKFYFWFSCVLNSRNYAIIF